MKRQLIVMGARVCNPQMDAYDLASSCCGSQNRAPSVKPFRVFRG